MRTYPSNQLPSYFSNMMSYHSVCQLHWNSCCPLNAQSEFLTAFILAVPSSPSEIHIAGTLISFSLCQNVTLPGKSSLILSKRWTSLSPLIPLRYVFFSIVLISCQDIYMSVYKHTHTHTCLFVYCPSASTKKKASSLTTRTLFYLHSQCLE